MAEAICLHDRDTIAAWLRRDPLLHLYAIGDLDDFFWPYTNWYALAEGAEIRQVILCYTAAPLLILHVLTGESPGEMRALLRSIMHLLPSRIYTHLSADVIDVFADDYSIEPHGAYDKMALTDASRLDTVDTSVVVRLAPADLPEIAALYDVAYPGHWFDPRMLQTGHYYGIRQGGGITKGGGALLSVAGVHVYSPRYRVAALGNITTHPEARGRGLATLATAKLCQELLHSVDQIGLNVRADNASAIACYTKLGFTKIGEYGEYELTLA
jgi:RimJ/RimL family protein N-acetyltransferase